MAKVKPVQTPMSKRGRPAISPEVRENQLISLAMILPSIMILIIIDRCP